jgi:hypothetical protein
MILSRLRARPLERPATQLMSPGDNGNRKPQQARAVTPIRRASWAGALLSAGAAAVRISAEIQRAGQAPIGLLPGNPPRAAL